MKPQTALLFVLGLTVFCLLIVVVSRTITPNRDTKATNLAPVQDALTTPSGISLGDAYNQINDNSRLDEAIALLGKADEFKMTGNEKNFADLIYQRGNESLIISVDTIQDGSWRVVDVFWCQGSTPARPYGTSRKEKFPNSMTPAMG